jgi:BRCA1-associated protein
MGKEEHIAGFHVHICLYSPTSTGSATAINVFDSGDLGGISREKEKSTAPRSLYEIARKVDRPLDSRFQSLSIAWLERPKQSGNLLTSNMSPDVHRKSRQARISQPASHSSAPTSPVYRNQPPSTAPTTPIARFVKESSFHVDHHDLGAKGGRDGNESSLEISFGIVHLFRDDAALSRDKNVKTRTTLEDDSGTILAVLGVPSHIGPADFLQLVEPAADAISQVRMIREENAGRCMVMLKFRDADHAEEFHKMYADQPFNPRDDPDELCRVVYVTKVTVSTTSTLPYAYPLLANSDPWPIMPQVDKTVSSSSTNLAPVTELPTCPVCLERMDSTVTGLMTVTCQHTFHCSCLSKWSDSRCPVCRYTQSRMISKGHHLPSFVPEHGCCAICGTGADLWVCLICAAVGCGRYKAGHAHRHFQETGHLYSLELETQRVWDYAGDGYVHRLIQSKAEFKSLDEGGPTPKSYRDSTFKQGSYGMEPSSSKSGVADRRNSSNAAGADMEDKMEALGLEYSNLLSTQLESQRAFYEDQVHTYQRKMESSQSTSQQNEVALQEAQRERDALRQRIEAMTSRHENAHTNLAASLRRLKQAEEDLRGERLMSQGLVARIDRMVNENETRKAEMDILRAENADLRDQVRDLMFFVEARTKVANEGGEELRDGTVALPDDKKAAVASTTTKNKKKKKVAKKPPTATTSVSDSNADVAAQKDGNENAPKAEFREEEEEDLYTEV